MGRYGNRGTLRSGAWFTRKRRAVLQCAQGTKRSRARGDGGERCIPAGSSVCYVKLQFEVWIGDAAKIRTKRVRKQKTDRKDGQLVWHGHRLVQMRTQVMNHLYAGALNEGLRRKKALWRPTGRQALKFFVLA